MPGSIEIWAEHLAAAPCWCWCALRRWCSWRRFWDRSSYRCGCGPSWHWRSRCSSCRSKWAASRRNPIRSARFSWRPCGEALVGLMLGLGVRILFAGLHVAGQIISQMSGLQLAEVFSPGLGTSVPLFTQLLFLVTTAVFLLTGGHRQLIEALLDTFAWLPPGQAAVSRSAVAAVTELVAQSFALGLRAAAPAMVALLLATLIVGFVSRTLPQLNVMSLGFGINALVAIAAVGVSLGGAAWLFQEQLQTRAADRIARHPTRLAGSPRRRRQLFINPDTRKHGCSAPPTRRIPPRRAAEIKRDRRPGGAEPRPRFGRVAPRFTCRAPIDRRGAGRVPRGVPQELVARRLADRHRNHRRRRAGAGPMERPRSDVGPLAAAVAGRSNAVGRWRAAVANGLLVSPPAVAARCVADRSGGRLGPAVFRREHQPPDVRRVQNRGRGIGGAGEPLDTARRTGWLWRRSTCRVWRSGYGTCASARVCKWAERCWPWLSSTTAWRAIAWSASCG